MLMLNDIGIFPVAQQYLLSEFLTKICLQQLVEQIYFHISFCTSGPTCMVSLLISYGDHGHVKLMQNIIFRIIGWMDGGGCSGETGI